MNIDDIYTANGKFGKFQKKMFFGLLLASLFMGTQMVENAFVGYLPKERELTCVSNSNLSGCDEHCQEHAFKDSVISFATEWDMVCSKRIEASATQSVYMFGVMVGSFIMGGIADRFGRFPSYIVASALTTLFSFVGSFTQSWSIYAVSRFLTGFCLSGISVIGFVLASELVEPSKRGLIGVVPPVAFGIGICILASAAWAIQSWRWLTVSMSIIGVILLPFLFCLFVESPRWYLGKGDIDKCKSVLCKIAEVNGYKVESADIKLTNADKKPIKVSSMWSVLRQPLLLRLTLIQLLSWFTISSIYYGLTLASGDMGANRYLSMILSAIVELPSNIITLYLINIPRLGRVKCCVASMILSSVCCFSIFFVSDEHSSVIVGMATTGKFFICMSFAIIYVQAAELYPTPVRNIGLGMVSAANRSGGVLAPLVLTLENLYHNSHFIVFGILGLVSGVLCLYIPETVGKPLPETVEDISPVGTLLYKNTNNVELTERLLSEELEQ